MQIMTNQTGRRGKRDLGSKHLDISLSTKEDFKAGEKPKDHNGKNAR